MTNLGKPILVMLVIAAVSGAGLCLRPGPAPRPEMVLWVFSESHARTYRGDGQQMSQQPPLVELYRRRTGTSVGVQLLSARAENVRLESIFMSDIQGPEVPDLAEIEIGFIGRFFRPPLAEIGFLPLNDYLAKSGWMDKVVKARFAPWTKEGKIFGIPHDVHPVTITYRKDLFDEAGVDLEKPATWPEFQEACLRFQAYWTAHGRPDRHAIELTSATPDDILKMLLQRHINLIDDYNRIFLDDPKTVKTVAFYAQLAAGPRKIAAQSSGGEGAIAQDLNGGNICAFMTADWRIRNLKDDTIKNPATGVPILQGKMRMRPLPIFDPGDARTSTWGGTMLAILKSCKRPDEAWKLAEFLYFSREGIESRRRTSQILPPVKAMWQDEAYQRPDPYFGGQRVEALYAELANEIPDHCITPATTIANAILSYVVQRAQKYVETRGTDGLEAACRVWLHEGARDLARRIAHGRYEEDTPYPLRN